MARPHARGFTLIELMIVVAIIAILAAIAVPVYTNYVLRSKVRTAQSNVEALSSTVENYRQRTLGYPPDDATAKQGWAAGTKPGDFVYTYTAPAAGSVNYTITAVAQSTLGKASGCTLTLNGDNTRTVSAPCASVGVSAWQ